METGAKKPAAAPAPAPSDATQQQALFEAKHAELLSEARDVAREYGVDVHAVVFRPDDGTAVRNEFLGGGGGGREARLKDLVVRAVARDVSGMGATELAAHERHLLQLRALVARELQARAKATASPKRSSEQQ